MIHLLSVFCVAIRDDQFITMIQYQITSNNPSSHCFDVAILIDAPDPLGQRLRLPNWIPGSYMIRDFARNLIDLKMESAGEEVTREIEFEQIDKSNWRAAPVSQPLKVSYKVYAKDLSVRTAHLDHSHGYYNGSSVFLEVVDQADQPCEVLIAKPTTDFCDNWEVATSLPRKQAQPYQFGLYQAADYDELIDHPVEMGEFLRIGFEACGVPHDIILTGRFVCDEDRLKNDLKTICEHHIRFFGEPAPMDYYQFQVMVVGDGYGGLEHRASTSLICEREGLPQPGEVKVSDGYRDFLGLCSHEYFHTWNVKRIKPQVYQPYDLQQEVYTELLWAFEGITSYYDDLALKRCGLIDETSYFELLAQTITRVQRGKGRLRQSAAESSFNTWTKFYKQDENAANAIVSYYAKGCLIAACIDLKLRELSASQVSLDDVMRRLWQDYLATGHGVEINSIQAIVSELAGVDLQDFLDPMISGTGELPLSELLQTVGVDSHWRSAINQADRGGKDAETETLCVEFGAFVKDGEAGMTVVRLGEGGSAQLAGLSAGDVIVAVDGLKLNQAKLEKKLVAAAVGDRWQLHAFRRDELHHFELLLQAAEPTTVVLKSSDQAQTPRKHWLGD
ncbi:MAG: putative metalloprotease with PDZ domain [Gammaproteobacteria bacterium]|jgi:predicted metalloprotease with PDZ domain